jgi:hypothetical protein
MRHNRVETAKDIYGHLFAQDRAFVLTTMNQAVSRLYACETTGPPHARSPGQGPSAAEAARAAP